jgi:hypothetical protein
MPQIQGTLDYLPTPAAPTVIQNTLGTGAAISYSVVYVNAGGQDTQPSVATTTPATNNATPNNTIFWTVVPGVAQTRILKGGNLLATVGPGINSYTDSAGSAGVTYTAVTTTTGNPQSFVPAVHSPIDGQKWTYRAAKQGLVPVASATDIAVLSGSASKVIRVTRVEVSGIATTILNTSVQLLLRTTADSGGTSTGSPTTFPLDQNAPTATGVVLTYTANPTVNDGTARPIGTYKTLFNIAAPAAGSESTRLVVEFGNRPAQAVVLRGTAQQLAVNLNGVSVSGGSIDVAFEWSEE